MIFSARAFSLRLIAILIFLKNEKSAPLLYNNSYKMKKILEKILSPKIYCFCTSYCFCYFQGFCKTKEFLRFGNTGNFVGGRSFLLSVERNFERKVFNSVFGGLSFFLFPDFSHVAQWLSLQNR